MGPITVKGKPYNAVMPPHETQLTDRQIAEVISYVRNAWGHRFGDVSEEQVKTLRAAHRDRATPWTAKELNR